VPHSLCLPKTGFLFGMIDPLIAGTELPDASPHFERGLYG
jgi:hypothetical protein